MTDITPNNVPDENPCVIAERKFAEAAELKAAATRLEHEAKTILSEAFMAQASDLLKDKPEPYGSVSIDDGNFKISFDFEKKVKWDESKLRDIGADITANWEGDDPNNYIDVKMSVSETKYKAWPPMLKKVFDPARTVSNGTTKVTLKKLVEEE